MDVLQEIIYEQNLEILQLIANDKYNDDEDKKLNFKHITDFVFEKQY